MIRDFIAITQVLWLFLIAAFVWLCLYNWTGSDQTLSNENFYCATEALENTNLEQIAPEIILGKEIFRNNCAACHARDMKTNLTGPPLLIGIEAWAEYPQADLFAFIRNSQALIATKHPRAVAVWDEYRPTVMNSFVNLSDEELEALLAYISYQGSGRLNKAP